MSSFFRLNKILVLLAFSFFGISANAEHIIGGEMYYVCNDNGDYIFTMKLYRDCNGPGAQFDNPANFAVFDDNDILVDQVQATVFNIEEIDPSFDSPCLNFPPDICVEEGSYQFMLQLDTDISGYRVVYQRCCRNPTVQNLENPGAQGLTIVAEVPQTNVADCNSSPFFNSFPPPILCSFEPLVFDHSATDPDGDELIYSLCAPYTGGSQADPLPIPPSNPPFAELQYAFGYSALDPLNADPMLSIDPATGLLTGTPTMQGQYVVGVCVEEWRNGILIGVNKRDFQFNVAPCEPISEALIQEIDDFELCDDLTFTFFNQSNPDNEYVWDFGDPTTDDDISIGFNGQYTYPDTGTYVVTLISNPGVFCSDTTEIIVPVYYEATIDIESFDFECINGEPVYSFTAGGTFQQGASTILWDFGPGSNPQTADGLTATGISFDTPGVKNIQVQAIENICEAQSTIQFTVPDPPEVSIDPQTEFCSGLNISFTQSSQNASLFSWEFGVSSTDGDVAEGAFANYTYPSPGLFTVTLIASDPDNCPISVQETFDVQPLLAPEVPEQDVFCFDGHSINFSPGGSFTNGADFSWSFPGANQSTSTSQNPSGITFPDPGVKDVILTIAENGCERTAEGTIIIHPNPVALFNAFPTEGCAPLAVSFINESITESSSRVFDWDFGDGNTSTGVNVVNEYQNPGTYSVSLYLENLNGCIDSDFIELQDLITVTPSPIASFDIEPTTISVLDPSLEVINLSEGAISCTYYFDDTIFEECDFDYELQNIEPQNITLVVENEFGCSDRAEAEIFISDHLIYIPNAFTPDGDGINEFFRPEMTGVLSFRMWIFDRWGQQVFYTENPQGWNGQGVDEEHYGQAQVYTYKMIITDYGQTNFEYTGSVRLIR